MSALVVKLENQAELRRRAASRLKGTAATKGSIAKALDALTVLHNLASSPETAPDALALLHELQVHQVELDLQAQEFDESRAELESALRRQIEIYEFQPVGCLTIDARLVLHELNRAGAEMLGIGRDDAYGSGLDAHLSAPSSHRLRSALASVDAGVPRLACALELHPRGGSERSVLASVGKDPSADRYLVTLMIAPEDEHERARHDPSTQTAATG